MADNFTYEILDDLNEYEAGEVYFGDWEVVKELGGGSYGTVYQMEKTDYGITLQSAMKVIRIPADPAEIKAMRSAGATLADISAMNEEQAADASREVRSMVSLQKHLNVVRCEDFRVFKYRNEERWDILIRMEMLCSLPDYFEKENISPGQETAVELGLAISRALTACEARKLLHRDIKPSNIFVEIDEFDGAVTYKLGDFGSSRASRGGSTAMTRRGTDFYMAPEVMTEDRYDARADIYSLGLVMYQLSNNNRLPFFPQPGQPMTFAAQNKALVRRLSNEPLPAPAGADAALAAIILKACAPKPEDRYSSAKELYQALESYRSGGAQRAKPAQPVQPEKPAKPAKPVQPAKPVGDAEAEYNRGMEFYRNEDYANAVACFRVAAAQGYAKAQNKLGDCYLHGYGVSDDEDEAARWYQRAAEQGNADAQNNLGYCCYLGLGVNEDYAEAARWYRKAAEQGHAEAQYLLGNCCYKGDGVGQDRAEAVRWYQKAAEQGYVLAQKKLGDCYQNGRGVSQDYAEAVRWYRKAAEQGDAEAQNNMGDCCYYGQGADRDYVEAVQWYQKAAEGDCITAQYNLGYCYYYGIGVGKDRSQALLWMNKAKENGDQRAADFLKNHLKFGRLF